MSLLPLQPGPWQFELENQASAILKADRSLHTTALNDKKDWFSEEQLKLRLEREVYSAGREIDRLIESGLYRREYNPLLGKRPTRRGRYSSMQDPWSQDSFDSFGWDGGVWLPSYSRGDKLVEGGQHYGWDIMLPHRDLRTCCRPRIVRVSVTTTHRRKRD